MALFTIRIQEKTEWRNHIQDGFWHLKGLFLIGMITVGFVIPNEFFLVNNCRQQFMLGLWMVCINWLSTIPTHTIDVFSRTNPQYRRVLDWKMAGVKQ
jgi:hypothetical protein